MKFFAEKPGPNKCRNEIFDFGGEENSSYPEKGNDTNIFVLLFHFMIRMYLLFP